MACQYTSSILNFYKQQRGGIRFFICNFARSKQDCIYNQTSKKSDKLNAEKTKHSDDSRL